MDARFIRDASETLLTTEASVGAGEIFQLPDGSAGFYETNATDPGKSTGDDVYFRSSGKVIVTKTTGIVLLRGGRVFWDHSANKAHFKKVNDRDFYIGRAVADADSSDVTVEVDLNKDPPYDLDMARGPFTSAITGTQGNASQSTQIGTRAKVGATAGFVVGAADNLPYVATLPASQTGSTLIIPIDGLRVGDTITGFTVIAQVESAGGTVTIDGDLRAVTNVAAEPTDASIGTMTQVSVTADTAVSQSKTGLTEVVTSGKSYYLKITATTAASTDIILQHCEIIATQATYGGTALNRRGSGHNIVISSTTEAQKVDMLSVDGFANGANAIVEFAFRVTSDGAGSAVDVSLGVANATHATDADSITESVFIHLNANDVNIYAESDDGTTEVAATDTTIDYSEGAAVANRVEVWLDMRNPADVQIYVDGVLVLGSTVFNVNVATGPWKLLAHVEKTSSTDTYEIDIDKFTARYMEQ